MRKAPTRKPKGSNLGKAVTLVVATENAMYAEACDLQLFAPGLHSRSHIQRQHRQARQLRRHVQAITGLPYRVFLAEVAARTSAKWVHYQLPMVGN